jgi:transcriptional regulator NrdR family protein
MECPFCGESDTGVIDSRPTKDKISIRRRRQCLACAGRFTTYETTSDRLMLLLMKTHGGKGGNMKSPDAVLSFMSDALKGLSLEFERLVSGLGKVEPAKVVKRKVRAKTKKRAPVRKKIRTKKVARPKRKSARKLSDTAKVLQAIRGYKKGVDVPRLKQKTGLADTKIRAIVFRASKEGKIKRLRRGVYISA